MADTFQFGLECPECGTELFSAPETFGAGKDGRVLWVNDLPKASFACVECRISVSICEPDARTDRFEAVEA